MHTADDLLHTRWIRERDAQAFKALASRYCTMVYGTCVRILRNPADAEEVTQECFIALAATQRNLSGPMGAWLHRVATYQALNRRRADNRRREREEQFARTSAASAAVNWDDIGVFVDEAIDQLPDKIRVAVLLHFMEDRTVTEIAQQEGVTHGAISQRIQKGVAQIRERLQTRGITIGMAALFTLFAQHANASVAVPAALSKSLATIALSGRGAVPEAVAASSLLVKGVAAAAVAALVTLCASIIITTAEPLTVTAAQRDNIPAVSAPAAVLAKHADTAPVSVAPVAEFTATTPEPSVTEAVAIAEAPPIPPAPASWREVVAAYTHHQNRIRHIAFDYGYSAKGPYYLLTKSPDPGVWEAGGRGTLLSDGNRCYLEHHYWGDWSGGELFTPDRPGLNASVWDGATYAQYSRSGASFYDKPGMIQIKSVDDLMAQGCSPDACSRGTRYSYADGTMMGFPLEKEMRLEEIVAAANRITLRRETEILDGNTCFVIDADTPYGDISIWFDAEHDYNVAQFISEQRGGHLFYDGVMPHDSLHRREYRTLAYTQVDGLWVSTESTLRHIMQARLRQGHDYTFHHKRTNVRLYSEGENEDAFVLRDTYIPNGAQLMHGRNPTSREIEWVWFDGAFVPRDPNTPRERAPRLSGGFGAATMVGVGTP